MKMTMEVLLRYYGWSQSPTIKECAEKAYRDLSRTMAYNKPLNPDKATEKEYEEEKNKYKESVNTLIEKRITKLLEELDKHSTENAFDCWHEKTCDDIIKMSEKSEIVKEKGFYYGQAQKWLNMTFKNMLIAGVKKVQLEKLEAFLHVPVDSFIISPAEKSGVKQPKGSNSAWSKWD